jgi:hypothetical protein
MREQVTFLRVKHPELTPLEGDLIEVSATEAELYVPLLTDDHNHPELEVGERLVLQWADREIQHAKAQIQTISVEESAQGAGFEQWSTFKLAITLDTLESELRHYPRFFGGIDLRYCPLSEDVELNVESWLDHQLEGPDESHLTFYKPLDSLINFSVTGLKFECKTTLSESTLLLCELSVGGGESQWRCLAKVIRTWQDEVDAKTAIHFISPPQGLIDELSEFTLKLQRAVE